MKYFVHFACFLLIMQFSCCLPTQFQVVTGEGQYYPIPQEVYTGYIPVRNNTGSSLFYQLFSAINHQNLSVEVPLIIWLQGGPGCSSISWGLYQEVGPYYISYDETNNSYQFVPNPYTWNTNFHMLFVDQPIGSGLSLNYDNDKMNNTEEASADFITFLKAFFKIYPQLLSYPIFIAGESYSGHYIPMFARDILEQMPEINLGGVAIGDGWVNSYVQTAYMDEIIFATGIVDIKNRERVSAVGLESEEMYLDGNLYESTVLSIDAYALVTELSGDIEIDNFKIYETAELEFEETLFERMLLEDTIAQTYMGIGYYENFYNCNMTVADDFMSDESVDFTIYYEEILNTGLPVLLYYGQNDMNCGAYGAQNWLKEMDWPPIIDFMEKSAEPWYNNEDEIAGRSKYEDNLSYAIVYNAGHMVPTDQPANAQLLVTDFILANT